ncbi:MAG: hypothetical protein IKX56_08155 [Muribaculaceae bacterium]|nr:hypothetical protein [Muribaculaceae bacterium]
MKKTLLYISLLTVVLVLGSCTRNHGDIGIWFGTWHVESIIKAGDIYQYIVPVDFEGDYFFQFQSKVFRVSQVGDHEQLVESFGTWNDSESGKMIIDFPDPDVFYIQMPGLEAHNAFTIVHSTSREMTLEKVTDDGTNYTYYLKKQP